MSLPLNIFTPTQAAILLGVAALLGAVFGSFINCLAWRLSHGESVLKGRSHCTSCGHALGPLELIPVISWFALRGRCRHCGERVSPRYVIVELLMAALFTLLLTLYGVGIPWLAYAALACILLGASLVDLDTFTIPNGFVIAAVIVWLFMMVASFTGMVDWPLVPSGLRSFSASLATDSLVAGAAPEAAASVFGVGSMFVPLVGAGWQAAALDGLAGGVAIGGGILVFSLAFDAATGKTSLGGGDVKLLFAVGLFLGVAMSLFNLLIACVMGLVFAAIRLRRPQRAPSGEEAGGKSLAAKAIPFGPAIAAATMLTLLIGPTVLTWYVGLF